MDSFDNGALSTDQVFAFVALARLGSLRDAAQELKITEQGLRNRLVALEERLGMELYRKRRGRRQATPLTAEGNRLLPRARAFLRSAEELARAAAAHDAGPAVIRVVASQYLIHYVLIDVIQQLHKEADAPRVRLSALPESEVSNALRADAGVSVGLAAPYDPSPELQFENLFSMGWSLITPKRHPLAKLTRPKLKDLCRHPMILLEHGSTGRHHIMDAFREANLQPSIEMEAANTDTIVRMVEAGLGISVVPLIKTGVVTKGRRVEIRSLGTQVRPIQSGVLTRKSDPLPAGAVRFLQAVGDWVQAAQL